MADGLGDDAFRARLARVLERSRLSRRGLSAAMGRDPDYVAALLDPSRRRARPTPMDLLTLSDATGIAFVELLEELWAIPLVRLASELGAGSHVHSDLTPAEGRQVAEFAAFLVSRR